MFLPHLGLNGVSRTAAGDVVSRHCSQFQMGVGLCIFHLLLWIVSVPSLLCSVPWDSDQSGQLQWAPLPLASS